MIPEKIKTGRRPMRSETVPQTGSMMMNTTLAAAPAHIAPEGSTPWTLMAYAGVATAHT